VSAGARDREAAPAKINVCLLLGPVRPSDGRHELVSVMQAVDLADELRVTPAAGTADEVVCAGVEGPNLAGAALAAFRARTGWDGPGLRIEIAKRIPVAAGMAGGSADAAAALRAANRLAGEPLGPADLNALAAGLGSDVPSQVEPRHALVQGVGEVVETIDLPALWVVFVPQAQGLSTASVYAELDRLEAWRARLEPEPLRLLAASAPEELAQGLENDLERAAVSLRPELGAVMAQLRAAGAPTSAP
jgi:4-diphosphocytidyl-2-C-methyl-D-erythritol kinase